MKGSLTSREAVDLLIRAESRRGPYCIPRLLHFWSFSISLLSHAKCRTHVLATKDNEPDTIIIFYHGGGYVLNFLDLHVFAVADIVKELGRCTCYLPEYPLAPKNSHTQIFDTIEAVYRQVVSLWPTKKIVVMGDSAGAGITLILSQRLSSARAKGDLVKQPDSVILLSPWLDISMTNPECEKYSALDPYLDIFPLKRFGEMLVDGPNPISTTDPRVSPLFGSLEGLPPVSIWTSTHDLLSPDSRALKERYEREAISSPLRFTDEKFLPHCWWMFRLPDGFKTIKEIVQAIKEDCEL